ncbi:LOW QUALITY PROTEIN: reverse transcriptase [Phytophthora megakarya]|uniref:Reverse transcriptase n=1 Tax=Phytophthora megakarya TaxID=4795 RepID=A0A225VX81_9STRA|nr:LOW QUALITY PROTEIN: reverse transcriptase [Phytophthora megakarya]
MPGWEVAKARSGYLESPRSEVVKARSGYLESLTVNEAEYNGLILGLDMLEDLDRRRLVVCGDSNLVIRQVRGEIDGLTLLKRKTLDRLRKWRDHELVHVKRDWNGSADSLACAALQRQRGIKIQEGSGYQDLVTLNQLDEILIPKTENPVVRVAAVATRAGRARPPAGVMKEGLIREIRIDRIKQAQEEEVWIAGMKRYLSGSIADLTQAEARSYGKIATDYEVDEQDLRFTTPRAESPKRCNRTSYITITPRWKEDIREWDEPTSGSGITSIEEDYTEASSDMECVDCETGKGKPVIRGESPGNLQATYPFQIIAMDHIPSLPRSHKGNTEILIWVDLFTGYVIAKASSSRSAQTVAESYEECVFRRFGGSEMIRHDREPGFMSDFFRAFNKILRQRQRATMAYRPQANGTLREWCRPRPDRSSCTSAILIRRIEMNMLSASPSRSTRLTIGSEEITLTIWYMGGIRERHWRLHCRSDVRDGVVETRDDSDIESSDTINNPGNKSILD